MIICGIDPGLTGAVCFLGTDTGNVMFFDMPVVTKAVGKGQQVSAQGLADVIKRAGTVAVCCVEAVHAMPKQGVSSMFSFGRTAGVIDGILAALSIPTKHIRPDAWKRPLGLVKADKDAARLLAMNLYPQCAGELSRKKDIGRADALLIAHYGREQMARTTQPA